MGHVCACVHLTQGRFPTSRLFLFASVAPAQVGLNARKGVEASGRLAATEEPIGLPKGDRNDLLRSIL